MRSSALERYLSRLFTIEPKVEGSARNPKIHLVIIYRARKCNGVTLTTWSASSFGSPKKFLHAERAVRFMTGQAMRPRLISVASGSPVAKDFHDEFRTGAPEWTIILALSTDTHICRVPLANR
jgi:hypothetical protein